MVLAVFCFVFISFTSVRLIISKFGDEANLISDKRDFISHVIAADFSEVNANFAVGR